MYMYINTFRKSNTNQILKVQFLGVNPLSNMMLDRGNC